MLWEKINRFWKAGLIEKDKKAPLFARGLGCIFQSCLEEAISLMPLQQKSVL